jgi:outer membrane protein TolC
MQIIKIKLPNKVTKSPDVLPTTDYKNESFMKTKLSATAIRAFTFSYLTVFTMALSIVPELSNAQDAVSITLPEAIDTGMKNYPSIKAKQNYVSAAQALTRNARNEYLPNVIASVQQNYGTINGQFGPGAPIGVLGVASSGPVYSKQNWNAAFGALYIVSANWEVFTFGRVQSRIQLSAAQERQNSSDLQQEMFIQKIKIASSYLNLLIAQRLVESARSNLTRAQTIQQNVIARTMSGLNPGVDSSLVNADVSKAKLSLIDFITSEQTVQRQLAELLGDGTAVTFRPDASLITTIPEMVNRASGVTLNPQLLYYKARVNYANQLTNVTRKSIMPGVTLFGVYQARASGFNYTYNPETLSGYSNRYQDGIDPSRYNYVAGISLTWNLTSPVKIRQQVKAQRFIATGYQYEYEQLGNQLQNQLILSDQRIENTLQSAMEVPVQYKAASDAYLQKSVLYKNGLTTMVDLQQAMYVLNRAEIDKSVAYANVWLALLLKAAASGDFNLFLNPTQ